MVIAEIHKYNILIKEVIHNYRDDILIFVAMPQPPIGSHPPSIHLFFFGDGSVVSVPCRNLNNFYLFSFEVVDRLRLGILEILFDAWVVLPPGIHPSIFSKS